MQSIISADHPKRILAFYVEGYADEEWANNFHNFMEIIVNSRPSWSIKPPFIVDYLEKNDDGAGSGRVIGGALELYSALMPHVVPVEIDRLQLKEVELIISAVSDLSARTGTTFGFYLDDDAVGSVECGNSQSLHPGFLCPWREHLAKQAQSFRK